MNNNERQIVEKIRSGYEEKKPTKLDELRELDRRAKRPAQVLAYILGSVGALVLGTGMCLAMPGVIEGYMPLGIGIGLVGILIMSVNYHIYKAHLKSRRSKVSSDVIRLSNEIVDNQ